MLEFDKVTGAESRVNGDQDRKRIAPKIQL